MSEKRMRPAEGRAPWFVGVAVGAMVVACDAPSPTELREPPEAVRQWVEGIFHGAAAASYYGVEDAGGVLLIVTKDSGLGPRPVARGGSDG